tara:strand:- start:2248 stop:5145 length:2898 start_codon:yes stop_codon:yes gene_type:complete
MENQSLGENLPKFKSLFDLLQHCKTSKNKQDKATNTRIGSKDPTKDKKYPGSYHIPKALEDQFHDLLDKQRKKGREEHMTEIQDRKKGGPLLYDFDFRHLAGTDMRQFNDQHINDMVELIAHNINKICKSENIEPFPLFVFYKDNINDVGNCVKDGIHMIIGLKMKHSTQILLRETILKEIGVVLEDIRSTLCKDNTPEMIIDEGVCRGEVGWQMYGSSKPGHEAYKLRSYYQIRFTKLEDDDDIDFSDDDCEEGEEETTMDFEAELKDIKDWNGNNLVKLFSLRRKGWQKADPRDCYKNRCKELVRQKKKEKKSTTTQSRILAGSLDVEEVINKLSNIQNLEEVEKLAERLIKGTEIQHYDIVTAHQLAMLLDENYYDPYDKWMKVGWALHNVSDLNIISFILFSAKSDKFDISQVDDLLDTWDKMRNDGLTIASLRYWAKACNPTEYEQLYKTNVNMFMEEVTGSEGADWDLAMLSYHLYGDKIKCIDPKSNTWMVFKNGMWKRDKTGIVLRKNLSLKLSRIFISREKQIVDELRDSSWTGDAEKQAELTSLTNTYNKIALKLKRSSDKNNIINEAKALYYDDSLIEKLDSNPYTIGFKNGVYDFEAKEFREGRPDDYISKTTKIDYIDCRKQGYEEGIEWLKDFMMKLFPDPNLRHYMWNHAATGLIGNNKNQTFNIYTGCGRNGKSKFVDLMRFGIGEYYGKVPTQLITQKRTSIGGTSSEVAQLKGIRYAVMTEPRKGDTINEGIMKEITGEDEIQARHLHQEAFVFVPQFTLCCMTNYLFAIKSNDDGTWRRIRKIDFESKFVNKPSQVPEDKEFKKDIDIEPKLKKYAPIFVSLLCEIACKNLGFVEDCPKVIAASNAYRGAEDYCHLFFEDMVEKAPEDASKEDYVLYKNKTARYFKDWYGENYGSGIPVPPVKEVVQYFEKKMGKLKKGNQKHHWIGYRWVQKEANENLDWMDNDD